MEEGFILIFIFCIPFLGIFGLIWCADFFFKKKKEKKELNLDRHDLEKKLRKELQVLEVDSIFDNFVGNEGAVTILKRELKYALYSNSTHLPAIGLFGPKSTGKTELARRLAKALNQPMLVLSKSTLAKEENFFLEVSKEIENYSENMVVAKPLVVFLDEAHVLSGRIQDSLLTALERNDRVFRSKAGDIDTRNITFVVATTDPGKLREAFRSRLISINLEPYTVQEVVDIMLVKVWNDDSMPSAVRSLSNDVLVFVAKASRAVPRKAIETLSMVGKAIVLGEVRPDFKSIRDDLRATLGCDKNGLLELDRKYLEFLSERPSAGIGLLSAVLGTDKNNLENVVEPWLHQNGWITRDRTGRSITPEGLKILEGN